MTYYLHIESPEKMAARRNSRSDLYLYFFERKLKPWNADDLRNFLMPHKAERKLPNTPHNVGHYVIRTRKYLYRYLNERFVLSGDLAREVQLRAKLWRGRELTLLGKYQALLIYPNEPLYWQELLRKVLAHPDNYPPVTDMDKLLFALTCNNARLFWDDPRQTDENTLWRDPELAKNATRKVHPIAKLPVPYSPDILYTNKQYVMLWHQTRTAAHLRCA